ncbi:type II toxin-antitoxin system HipA family toxin [Steroidobacter flavus]|uniref:Type II toxin-antitoxin system HipA family toxin n=1 Tax=Steroidobacter flavus TaxID=1842136 RepID=A0ABV8SVL9_9GAMM
MARVRLNVFLNARLVGQLSKETSGASDFRYDKSWLRWEHTFPISLSLPLRTDNYGGETVNAVFDNLIPDSMDIRRRIAERVGAHSADAFDLLSAIGRDCVGALQFLQEDQEPAPAGTVDGERITPLRIAKLLTDLGSTPLGLSTDDTFRISIAGAQEKTALLRWNNRWHLPRGSTATTHIIKPQIGVLKNGLDLSRSVENEYLCMQLAAAADLPAAKTAIADFAGQRALVVERFDRQWTKDDRLLRLPQEDLCQALSVPPTRKYQSEGGPGIHRILQLLKSSDRPGEDQLLFLKAQIFFWLLGATDGHAKNFSIFLYPGGGFRLTPLYDILSLQPNYAAQQVKRNRMKLAMSVGDSRHYVLHTIQPRHFIQSAAQAGVSRRIVERAMDELQERVPVAMAEVAAKLPSDFPRSLRKSIFSGIEERLKTMAARS